MRGRSTLLISFALSILVATPGVTQSSATDMTAAAQGFGVVVAIGDGEIAIGEPRNLFRPGTVYIYRKTAGGAWEESSQLTAPDAALQDRFGRSIAVSGKTMLVAADPRRTDTPGLVYVFTSDAQGNWTATDQLRPSDGVTGDGFGTALLLRNNFALVGAPNRDSAGAVYVFHQSENGEWLESAILSAAEGASGDGFGSALGLSGAHLMVGAPSRDDGNGAVYHFHQEAGTGAWVEQGALEPNRRTTKAGLGSSLVMSGTTAYVGMPTVNERAGGVAVYRFDENEGWEEETPLVPFDSRRRAGFGTSLALVDDGLWVGAPGSRSIYAFTSDDDGWSRVVKVLPEEPATARSFGGAMAVAGGLAVVGVSGADNGAGTAVVLERDGDEWLAATMLSSPIEGLDAITGTQVDCQEGSAASYTCQDVDLLSFLPVSAIGGGRGIRLNDVWGWTDPETGREYALIGRIDATAFVDQTDPLHPRYLGELPKTEGALTSVWRDIKVYKNHAFIVSDGAGQHGMQVFDLTQLRDVGATPVTFPPTVYYDQVASAHNIVINEETGYAYIVGASRGGTTCGGGLHMVDIREPTSPKFAGCFADTETGRRGTGYSHDAQCVIYSGPDEDYVGKEVCIGANETAISFADVSNKDNPTLIANVSYPNVAYAHQGWLTEDQRYFYSNDEGDEPSGSVSNTRTLVWDVSDLDDPILVGEYFATTTDTDHNLYVRDNLMYQSNYGAGLRIIDISDPENPVEVGYFDTAPDELGCCGSWSNYPYFESRVIPVTGGNAGIFFVKKHEAPVP